MAESSKMSAKAMADRHYRGFIITQGFSVGGYWEPETFSFRHMHFQVLYGPSFPSDLRGGPVLSTSGDKTWPEAEETIDLLIACGFDPQKGVKGDVYEYFALDREIRFRRAFDINPYLPDDRKFYFVTFKVVGTTPSMVGTKEQDPWMVSMPEYDKRTGLKSTFSVDHRRFPKSIRPKVAVGTVWSCWCNLSQTDMIYGGITYPNGREE